MVDFEHPNDTPAARLSGPVPAAAWIKALQARSDGIWGLVQCICSDHQNRRTARSDGIRGLVQWTARAADMIAAKECRYLSPVILHQPDTREIMCLKGASLVHNPNFLRKRPLLCHDGTHRKPRCRRFPPMQRPLIRPGCKASCK